MYNQASAAGLAWVMVSVRSQTMTASFAEAMIALAIRCARSAASARTRSIRVGEGDGKAAHRSEMYEASGNENSCVRRPAQGRTPDGRRIVTVGADQSADELRRRPRKDLGEELALQAIPVLGEDLTEAGIRIEASGGSTATAPGSMASMSF